MKIRIGDIRFLFPEGKDKALTFSYDDARDYDRRLVSIFDKYQVKATFHLNSGTLNMDGYVTAAEVKELYVNHEVACHAVSHPFFNQLSKTQMVAEIYEDRRALEQCCGKLVRGMSYPFGEYNEQMIRTASDLGIVYNRTVGSTMDFSLPADFMKWNPTCHHMQVTDALMENFLNAPAYRNLSLFYIWGHSYEFEDAHNWEHISGICEKLGGREDVWYATNIEIYEYVEAMRAMVMSADGDLLYNPTAVTLYLRVGDRVVTLSPGRCQSLNE